MENINPQYNNFLIGHEEEEKFLVEAFRDGSLHNSWLFCGIEGIGKATLAYKFARLVLDDKDNLIATGAHPDFRVLERNFRATDRQKIIKAINSGNPLSDEEKKELKKSSEIVIGDVREIQDFLSKRSAFDGWRVVIVDSVDEMNSNSANGILKILEEPPYKTLIILISHNSGRLLPTIKSRCAKLILKPLYDNNVASLLRRYRPNVNEKDIKVITKLCSGSIGKAINFVDNNAVKCYDDLCKIIYAKEKFKITDLLDFCDNMSREEEKYELAQDLILKFISDNIQNKVEELGAIWDKAIEMFRTTEGLNMDKKQTLMNLITSLCKVI